MVSGSFSKISENYLWRSSFLVSSEEVLRDKISSILFDTMRKKFAEYFLMVAPERYRLVKSLNDLR